MVYAPTTGPTHAAIRRARVLPSSFSSARFWGLIAVAALFALLGTLGGRLSSVYNTTYASTTSITFLAPGQQVFGTSSPYTSSLVKFALAVETKVNAARPVTRFATDDVDLYSSGVRKGIQISLPNNGTQWEYSFRQPRLDIDVVGATRQEVVANRNSSIQRVRRAISSLKSSLASAGSEDITSQIQVGTGSIIQVNGGRQSPDIAATSGAGAGVVAFMILYRLQTNFRLSRPQSARRKEDDQ